VASKPKPPTDTLPELPELADLRARVAELEARETEHARAERVQAALYRIAEAASAAIDLQAFYREVHATVATLMSAENFYIALYDDRRQAINFPYYVDTVDLDIPDSNLWEPFGVGNARGTTAYVLRTGRPEIVTPQRHHELVAQGEIERVGVVGEGDWLGAPLRADKRTIGVVVCQTYEDIHYSEADRDLLAFVGQHIGAALTRVRAMEETRQRNEELALINEIGSALAQQLDFQAIIDLVGERVGSIFESRSLFIALHDAERDTLTFPYDQDEGQPFHRGEFKVGPGLTSTVLRSGRSLRIGSIEEQMAAGALQVGGSDTQSWLGAPIPAGNRVIGVIGLESLRADAFTEADERLLNTLSASLGVALENARLFDETKRLLTETEHRNAELAVINDIGDALGQQLEFDAIIEAVGDRLSSSFPSRDMFIALYDKATNRITFPYELDRGKRVTSSSLELGEGLTSQVLASRRPLRLGTRAQQKASGGSTGRPMEATSTRTRRSHGWGSRSSPAMRRSASSCSAKPSRMRSARATSASSARSRRAWASPSKTPGSSARPPTARPSWP
jgi:GAF domain-containing protein